MSLIHAAGGEPMDAVKQSTYGFTWSTAVAPQDQLEDQG